MGEVRELGVCPRNFSEVGVVIRSLLTRHVFPGYACCPPVAAPGAGRAGVEMYTASSLSSLQPHGRGPLASKEMEVSETGCDREGQVRRSRVTEICGQRTIL